MSTPSFFSQWFASTPPPASVEVTSRRVNAVSLAVSGATRTVTGHASEGLPAGVVTPSLNALNISDPGALTTAVKIAVDRLSPRPRRVALVLPDTVVKVSLLRFDKVPPKPQELDQLIRWQMRKAAPFRIEDGQLSWAESSEIPGGGREYLVVLARRDIIESYEQACEGAGLHAGIVDIVSLNLINAAVGLAPAPIPGDWLLVHTAADYATLAVVRAGHVIFFRTRPSDAVSGADIGDLVHQTSMYHEDRLGGGSFSRVIISGLGTEPGDVAERMKRQIEERLGVPAEPLDVTGGLTLRDRIVASPALLDALAPAAGILLRDRTVERTTERVA
ncbi:MAG TPA: pilus assembly protein PilM [Vicinamibacterales bacterium]|nr:pilus assembly protein PilM [Vicinamibacterales bacterium]